MIFNLKRKKKTKRKCTFIKMYCDSICNQINTIFTCDKKLFYCINGNIVYDHGGNSMC